jgi:hypothetical protein
MYERMADDMDINCGTILDGEETVEQCGQRIFDLMLKPASGQPTKSESFDFITHFLVRGFDPLIDAIEYGRELIPLTRKLIAERQVAKGEAAE